MTNNNIPKFIVFEGPDGAGKTTLINKLHDWMNNTLHRPAVAVANPGTTEYGQGIRRLLFSGKNRSHTSQLLGMLSAQREVYEEVIIPNVSAGNVILCDRWLMSSRVYQGFIQGRSLSAVDDVIRASFPPSTCLSPSIYIVLNADPVTLLERLERDKKDNEEIPETSTEVEKEEEQELDDESSRKAEEADLKYFQSLHVAYKHCTVFSDHVITVYIDTDEMTEDEVFHKVCEIMVKGVLNN